MKELNDFQKRIGVGEASRAFPMKMGTSRNRPVIQEEGPSRGRVGGYHTDHWDGRTDAIVQPDVVRLKGKRSKSNE